MNKQFYNENADVSSFNRLKNGLNVITTGAVVLGLIATFQEKIAETEKPTNIDDSTSIDVGPAQTPRVEQYDQELHNANKIKYEQIVSLAWGLYPYYRNRRNCLENIPLLIKGKNWTLDVRGVLPSGSTYTPPIEIPPTAVNCYSTESSSNRIKQFVLTRQSGQTQQRLTFPIWQSGISMYLQEFEEVRQRNVDNPMIFYKEKGPKSLIANINNADYCVRDNPFGYIECGPNQNPDTLYKWLSDIEKALIAQPARAQAAQRAAQDKAAADALKALEKATK